MEHKHAKNACAKAQSKGFPYEIVGFASAFVELQQHRHEADYNPSKMFKRSEVALLIAEAENAILNLRAAPRADLRAFVALVLLPERRL